MTLDQIKTQANRGNIADPDIDLDVILRYQVVPRFLKDVRSALGAPSWLRKTLTVNVVSPTRNYDIAADVEWIEKLKMYFGGTSEDDLLYIGEDPNEVIRAESNTSLARPSGWYLVAGSTTPLAIRLNYTPDNSYTIRGVYFKTIVFADSTTDVNMDTHIPAQHQWGLVHLLRAEILQDRYGLNDNRAGAEMDKYSAWLSSMSHLKEAAGRTHARFVR